MPWKHREAGFTFVEVLIVAAILAFIMAGVFGIYQATQKSTLFATAGEDAQLTTRAVLDRLRADFQLIGAGLATTTGAIIAATPTSITLLGDIDNTLDANGNFITVPPCFPLPCVTVQEGDRTIPVGAAAAGTDLSALFPCGSTVTIADGPVMESHPLAAAPCVNNATKTLTLAEALLTWYPAGSIVRSVEQVVYAWDGAVPGNLCRAQGVGAACTAPYPDPVATGVVGFSITYCCDSAGNVLPAAPPNPDLIRTIQVLFNVRTQSGDQIVTRSMEVTARPRNLP